MYSSTEHHPAHVVPGPGTAYLLEFTQAPAFDALRPAYPHLRFLLSGHWPQYSFVTPMEMGEPVAMPEFLKLGSR